MTRYNCATVTPEQERFHTDRLILDCRARCWRDGDLRHLLHDDQVRALDAFEAAPGSRFVLEIARRWGKTWLLLVIAFMACLRKPRARVVYGAPTLKHLAEFVLPIFEQLRALAPVDVRPSYNAASGHIEFPNGSHVHLFGADDKRKADRGRGAEADLAIFDEAGFCSILRYVLRSVFRPSLLHTGGRTILGSTPAEAPDHDFTAIAEKAEANRAYLRRTVWDNPRLTKAQIEKFVQDDAHDEGVSVETYLESDEFRREYLAERVINRLLLGVPEWIAPWRDGKPYRETHMVAIERPSLFRGHTIIDFGGNDPHALQLGYWHVEKGLVIERDRLMTKDERSRLLSDEVKALEKQTWGVERWDGTLEALNTRHLREHFRYGQPGGVNIPDWLIGDEHRDAPPQPFMRICDVNLELARHLYEVGVAAIPARKSEKPFMVQQLRNLIADGNYWLHPSCVDTDRHLKTTTWHNEKRKAWARRGGEHGDLVDCSVYFALMASRDVPIQKLPAMFAQQSEAGEVTSLLERRLKRAGLV